MAISASERLARSRAIKRNASKLAAGRRKAEKKVADAETIMKRARNRARKAIEAKLLQGQSKSELSASGKDALEKRVDKKKAAIEKLAKKLFKQVKAEEQERRTSTSE